MRICASWTILAVLASSLQAKADEDEDALLQVSGWQTDHEALNMTRGKLPPCPPTGTVVHCGWKGTARVENQKRMDGARGGYCAKHWTITDEGECRLCAARKKTKRCAHPNGPNSKLMNSALECEPTEDTIKIFRQKMEAWNKNEMSKGESLYTNNFLYGFDMDELRCGGYYERNFQAEARFAPGGRYDLGARVVTGKTKNTKKKRAKARKVANKVKLKKSEIDTQVGLPKPASQQRPLLELQKQLNMDPWHEYLLRNFEADTGDHTIELPNSGTLVKLPAACIDQVIETDVVILQDTTAAEEGAFNSAILEDAASDPPVAGEEGTDIDIADPPVLSDEHVFVPPPLEKQKAFRRGMTGAMFSSESPPVAASFAARPSGPTMEFQIQQNYPGQERTYISCNTPDIFVRKKLTDVTPVDFEKAFAVGTGQQWTLASCSGNPCSLSDMLIIQPEHPRTGGCLSIMLSGNLVQRKYATDDEPVLFMTRHVSDYVRGPTLRFTIEAMREPGTPAGASEWYRVAGL